MKGKLVAWKDLYNTVEEVDFSCPFSDSMLGLKTTVYFDSNFAHDEGTRRSISEILVFVGNCPVMCASPRQGSIATSTFGAELCAAKTGVEESINITCMLQSLAILMGEENLHIGDNLGSLILMSNPGTPCKKKNISHLLSFCSRS